MARTVHGHLIDLGGIVLLDVAQDPDVIVLHKVDGHTLTSVTTGAANPGGKSKVTTKSNKTTERQDASRRVTPVDVELSVVGQVVVDDQRNLRDVQPSSPHVCRDQDAAETQRSDRGSVQPPPHGLVHFDFTRWRHGHLAPDRNSFIMDSLSF